LPERIATEFNCWLTTNSPLFHLRVIVSWSGYTQPQIAAVQKHNSLPVLLVAPLLSNVVGIYGELASSHLKGIVSYALKTEQQLPSPDENNVEQDLLDALHMSISTKEEGWD